MSRDLKYRHGRAQGSSGDSRPL